MIDIKLKDIESIEKDGDTTILNMKDGMTLFFMTRDLIGKGNCITVR